MIVKGMFVGGAVAGLFLLTHATDKENDASRNAYYDIGVLLHNKAVAWWFAAMVFDIAMIFGVALS